MVRTYFGLPGCGKTTEYARIAVQVSKLIDKGKCKYSCIVGNVALRNVPHYYKIDFNTIGKVGYPNALILIDEATLEADSRNWGIAKSDLIAYILLHRHWENDMFWFCQIWNRLEKTVRDITEEVVYLHKGRFLPGFTHETTIRYGIMIPAVGQDKPGEILMGYLQPTKLQQFLEPRFWRRPYYKYFDTLERPPLPLFDCPENRSLYSGVYDFDAKAYKLPPLAPVHDG